MKTAKEVATAAGVSKWTVIRAFTPGASITEESKRRVLESAAARREAVTMRLLGNAQAVPPALMLALLLVIGLTGCDDEADRTAVDDVVRAADDARAGVLHEIADALVLTGAEGTRSFSICGDQLAPGGVVLNDFVHFGASGALTQEKATATRGRKRRAFQSATASRPVSGV